MRVAHKVLLVGATGETGAEILEGLLADDDFVRETGSFDLPCGMPF